MNHGQTTVPSGISVSVEELSSPPVGDGKGDLNLTFSVPVTMTTFTVQRSWIVETDLPHDVLELTPARVVTEGPEDRRELLDVDVPVAVHVEVAEDFLHLRKFFVREALGGTKFGHDVGNLRPR